MRLPSPSFFPRRLRRLSAIIATIILAITLLVIVFYFLSRPYIDAQLGPVADQSSGRVAFKVPIKLARDTSLISPLFGGERGEIVLHATAWSWRDQGSPQDSLDSVRFLVGYSYVVAKGAIPSDRASVISQLKQSSQASIVSRVQTIAKCKQTPAIKLYDYHPAGANGFYYDYSCINDRDRKMHGLVGFLLVDNSNELHLLMMLGRDDVWQANRTNIAAMLSGTTVKK